jgi:hypothetical protein
MVKKHPAPCDTTGHHASISEGGAQTATLRRVEGAEAAGTGDGERTILEGAPVSTGRDSHVTDARDYRFFAGWRSDPFFFDTMGALNNMQLTGDDFFVDKRAGTSHNYFVELLYQRRTRRARRVFQRLALSTPVSISKGMCSE